MPKKMPENSVAAIANPSTPRSSFGVSPSILALTATIGVITLFNHEPIAMPRTPPPSAQSRLSITSCRIKRTRLAPMAPRMANSRCRAAPRAKSKFATLVQAIMSTSATIANKTSSAPPVSRCSTLRPRAPGVSRIFLFRKA
jgi:hypothetical protein